MTTRPQSQATKHSYSFWTADHEAILRQGYARRPVRRLARTLGHSPAAICWHATACGLTGHPDYYTAADVARGVGCSLPTVTKWIGAHYLSARRRTTRQQAPRWAISDDALTRFFRTYPHLWERFSGPRQNRTWIESFL